MISVLLGLSLLFGPLLGFIIGLYANEKEWRRLIRRLDSVTQTKIEQMKRTAGDPWAR